MPTEWLSQFLVVNLDVLFNSLFQFTNAGENASIKRTSPVAPIDQTNARPHSATTNALVGVKCSLKRECLASQVLTSEVL